MNRHATRTEMLEYRRRQNLPHQSFDLDGDGAVGQKDMYIASKFAGSKGDELSCSERGQALRAIENNDPRTQLKEYDSHNKQYITKNKWLAEPSSRPLDASMAPGESSQIWRTLNDDKCGSRLLRTIFAAPCHATPFHVMPCHPSNQPPC